MTGTQTAEQIKGVATVESEQPRASWQSEPCPAWCTRRHADDDHPDDRYHDSAPTQVPAILLERDAAAGPGRWSSAAGEITIITSRYVDGGDTITVIGREDLPDRQLSLTPEGAARLAEAIARHVALLELPA